MGSQLITRGSRHPRSVSRRLPRNHPARADQRARRRASSGKTARKSDVSSATCRCRRSPLPRPARRPRRKGARRVRRRIRCRACYAPSSERHRTPRCRASRRLEGAAGDFDARAHGPSDSSKPTSSQPRSTRTPSAASRSTSRRSCSSCGNTSAKGKGLRPSPRSPKTALERRLPETHRFKARTR